MLNMRDHKTKKIISTIIVVILVLAMIVPMALSALMYSRICDTGQNAGKMASGMKRICENEK